MIAAGKVRAIGASNYAADRLEAALAISQALGLPRFESFQPWYNLYDRVGFEGAPAQLCQREQLSVIPYFGLASGFLTGKYRSEADLAKSTRGQGVKRMLDERGLRILAAIDRVASDYAATPAQVALAWLRAHGVTAPITSATRVEQLTELLGYVNVELNADAVATLDSASEGGEPPPEW